MSYGVELIFTVESYENNVLKIIEPTFGYGRKDYEQQLQWNRMSEGGSPAMLYFKLDGDNLYVYSDKVSASNLLYELARADDNTITQKKNVETGSYDASKIKFPKHGNYITVHDTLKAAENLRLRS